MTTHLERGAHLVGTYLESTLGDLGLTQGEAHVLAQLAQHGTMPIATLHHEFGHKRSTLTNILDRLERRKLVRRELNREDRRSFLVALTPAGSRTARQVSIALDRLEKQLAGRVSRNDAAGLVAIVEILDAIVRPHPVR